MGKPAARVGDMTAHGGVITGPGCPTVLIGKMPAAQIGNMHVCPMVTPATPPIPHVGGPIIGPVPPTVFIGKMPAACVGDMCICVGPPSTILPPGCPTVLLGMASGGGAGAAGSAASASGTSGGSVKGGKAENSKSNKKSKSKVKPKNEQESSNEEESESEEENSVTESEPNSQEDEEPIYLSDIIEILEQIESEEGYEAARFFAMHLDYSKLTDMAKKFVTGEDANPENDPNQMPTRYMLLYGADDSKLTTIDNHPDNFDGQPDHPINVANLRKGLRLLGYAVAETGPYNDEVMQAHAMYMSTCRIGTSYSLDELDGEEESQQTINGTKSLTIKLDIDSNDPVRQDDMFILYSTGNNKKYQQIKTVKDDADSSNNTLELVFTGLDESLTYTLEIDPGAEGNIEYLFRNCLYGKWV